ncbi:LPXTG cell wall anchor domain-containing protein [Enterococcus faecalis]|uniref:LPXTG cell wall anchor domain-containing protein n=1 Tax=Enterococcus faecalis TaxID=1351 RepID=UPI001C3C6808|nr:LPXTG cell wall anchor domain-containing protein [Enterococcus faecalis]EKL7627722.1 LPXTG cell wall anchor domain-containing protein [Enterococcus faecalis]
MKKFALLTLFSTALLVSAPLVSYADETASSSDINILADDDPVVPVDPTDPTDSTTPVDPVDPVDPSEPTEPSEPIEEPTEPTEPSEPVEEPTEPTEPSEPIEEPTESATNPNVTDNPTESPVTTDQGHVIVAVEDSKPIVQLADGTTQKVEASEIGATVQNDGTVAVTGNDGKMKVLPQTGEKETIALSIAGIFMTLTGGFSLFRLNKRDRAKS